MGAGHGDRLTSVDTAFLNMETGNLHMHVGGLFVFDTSEASERPTFTRFLRLVRSRLHLVPRYRQKLGFTPFGLSNPVWVDDTDFDLSYHVRHAALPRPGTMGQLTEYCARILSRQLDRDRPLWELYVIEDLENGRVALLGKNHHAMIDGVAGLDIASVMLDLSPDGSADIREPEPWTPERPPSGASRTWSLARDLVIGPRTAVDAVRRIAAAPSNAADKALTVGKGVISMARSSLTGPAPRSILNQQPGQGRRFAVQRVALDEVKAIKNAFGTTVNDVVLAVVADATGRYLRSKGADTGGLWLRVMVPVSVRAQGDQHALGNRVVSVFVELPMYEMDPVERLHVCQATMGEVKQSHHAVGAGFLIGLSEFAPPTIHAMASRLAARGRLFNFLVTNVPGPQIPIYCLGARLLAAFPFTPLAATQSYSVGLTSIDGWLNFGFTADSRSLPDIDAVPDLLLAAVAELSRCAEAAEDHHDLAMSAGPDGAIAEFVDE